MFLENISLPELERKGFQDIRRIVTENGSRWISKFWQTSGFTGFAIGIFDTKLTMIRYIGCGKNEKKYLDLVRQFQYLSDRSPGILPEEILPPLTIPTTEYWRDDEFMAALKDRVADAKALEAISVQTKDSLNNQETAERQSEKDKIMANPIQSTQAKPGRRNSSSRLKVVHPPDTEETPEDEPILGNTPLQEEIAAEKFFSGADIDALLNRAKVMVPVVVKADHDLLLEVIRPAIVKQTKMGPPSDSGEKGVKYNVHFKGVFQRYRYNFRFVVVAVDGMPGSGKVYLIFDEQYHINNYPEGVIEMPTIKKDDKMVMRYDFLNKKFTTNLLDAFAVKGSQANGQTWHYKFNLHPVARTKTTAGEPDFHAATVFQVTDIRKIKIDTPAPPSQDEEGDN